MPPTTTKYLGFKWQPLFSQQISLNFKTRAFEPASFTVCLWRSISLFSSACSTPFQASCRLHNTMTLLQAKKNSCLSDDGLLTGCTKINIWNSLFRIFNKPRLVTFFGSKNIIDHTLLRSLLVQKVNLVNFNCILLVEIFDGHFPLSGVNRAVCDDSLTGIKCSLSVPS